MSRFRTYFSKNNCLIGDNYTNNSNNPAIEVSTVDVDLKNQSRYIFDIDLTRLNEKIDSGVFNQNNVKHYLNMTNTIHYAPDNNYINSFNSANRASSFTLDLYNINEDWDGGNGYDIIYGSFITNTNAASNWYEKKTNELWDIAGSDVNEVLKSQSFDTGSENIKIDITEYINQRLFGTGYTGTTIYSGSTFGLGLKFEPTYESTPINKLRQFVSFHGKNTNTFYEPFIETVISDELFDNRDFFQLDTNNKIYLYLNNVKSTDTIVVSNVDIIDYNGIVYNSISEITKVKDDLYEISLNIGSNTYPDCIIFTDEWSININGVDKKYSNEFYIQPNEHMSLYSDINDANINNYYFSLIGISENEQIHAGEIKKIKINSRSIYETKLLISRLTVEYRLFTKVGKNFYIDIIPFSLFNRTIYGYEFDLDTSWLIPQDYFIEIKLTYYGGSIKKRLSFTVIENLLG